MRPPLALLTALAALAASSARAAPPLAPTAAPDPGDVLGNIVVEAGARRVLPKIAVVPSLASAQEDVAVRGVVRRDLELCGDFELHADTAAPDGVYLPDATVDTRAWSAKGVEAIVRVSGKPRGADQAELRGEVFFPARGATAVFDKRYAAPAIRLREASHRLADQLIGALTGTNGGFASRLVFAMGTGGVRWLTGSRRSRRWRRPSRRRPARRRWACRPCPASAAWTR